MALNVVVAMTILDLKPVVLFFALFAVSELLGCWVCFWRSRLRA
jgi:hypothetical protein